MAERAERWQQHYANNPENLLDSDRCLVIANTAMPPLVPNVYNNTVQIVQTAGAVAIVREEIHDARIIPTKRRGHLPSSLRLWKGDSIGRWEGDSFVVDTTNFSDETSFRGSGPGLHIVERFRMTGPDVLAYTFTIEDPDSFTRPWTAEVTTRWRIRCEEPGSLNVNIDRFTKPDTTLVATRSGDPWRRIDWPTIAQRRYFMSRISPPAYTVRQCSVGGTEARPSEATRDAHCPMVGTAERYRPRRESDALSVS